MNNFYYSIINQTGQPLLDAYANSLPIGTPVRYTFDSTEKKFGKIWIDYENLLKTEKSDEEDWQAFIKAGIDFPVVDPKYIGKPYDNFWASGFGSIMPDRIYHVEISTNQKWVWLEQGYSPSEPAYIACREESGKCVGEAADGVVISLVSPMSTENMELRYLSHILNIILIKSLL